MAAETAEQTSVFTESDRAMLADIHVMLADIHRVLNASAPLIEKASRLLDNPATRWRRKHAVPQNEDG